MREEGPCEKGVLPLFCVSYPLFPFFSSIQLRVRPFRLLPGSLNASMSSVSSQVSDLFR